MCNRKSLNVLQWKRWKKHNWSGLECRLGEPPEIPRKPVHASLHWLSFVKAHTNPAAEFA